MSIVDDFKKLEPSDFAITFGLFVSVIAPGFLTIFLFKPELVASLDTFKLLVFSSALTLPIVALNYIAIGVNQDASNSDRHIEAFLFSMLITCSIMYVALLISYFGMTSFKVHLGMIAIVQLVVLVISYFVGKKAKK